MGSKPSKTSCAAEASLPSSKSYPEVQGISIREDEIELLQCLGSGAGAKVFRARFLGGIVACKCFQDPSKGSSHTVFSRADFLEEVHMLLKVRSSYVVNFLGACLSFGQERILTEYCDGGDLYHALDADHEKDLAWNKRGKQIAMDVAKGLVYLERAKILHLDIKSLNILLNRHGPAKIAALGFSKFIRRPETEGRGPGTFDWAAPEFLLGGKCSHKTDIFSFGVVMLEIVTGRAFSHRQYPTPRSGASLRERSLNVA